MGAPDVGKWLTPAGVITAAVATAALVLWWNRRAIADAAVSVGQAVNPTSDQNLAYRGVNAIGAAVTGDSSFSLGSWVYDLTHPNEGQRLGLSGPAPAPSSSAYGQEPAYDFTTVENPYP